MFVYGFRLPTMTVIVSYEELVPRFRAVSLSSDRMNGIPVLPTIYVYM